MRGPTDFGTFLTILNLLRRTKTTPSIGYGSIWFWIHIEYILIRSHLQSCEGWLKLPSNFGNDMMISNPPMRALDAHLSSKQTVGGLPPQTKNEHRTNGVLLSRAYPVWISYIILPVLNPNTNSRCVKSKDHGKPLKNGKHGNVGPHHIATSPGTWILLPAANSYLSQYPQVLETPTDLCQLDALSANWNLIQATNPTQKR